MNRGLVQPVLYGTLDCAMCVVPYMKEFVWIYICARTHEKQHVWAIRGDAQQRARGGRFSGGAQDQRQKRHGPLVPQKRARTFMQWYINHPNRTVVVHNTASNNARCSCVSWATTHTHAKRKAHQGNMGWFIGTIHSIRRRYHQTTANNKTRERRAFRIRHCARTKKIIASPYVYRIHMAFFCSSIANGRSRTIGDSLFRSNVIRRSVVTVIRSFHHCCVYILRVWIIGENANAQPSPKRAEKSRSQRLWMCLARATVLPDPLPMLWSQF
jgi:hypothetical protein